MGGGIICHFASLPPPILIVNPGTAGAIFLQTPWFAGFVAVRAIDNRQAAYFKFLRTHGDEDEEKYEVISYAAGPRSNQ